jgi:hypothetical protein
VKLNELTSRATTPSLSSVATLLTTACQLTVCCNGGCLLIVLPVPTPFSVVCFVAVNEKKIFSLKQLFCKMEMRFATVRGRKSRKIFCFSLYNLAFTLCFEMTVQKVCEINTGEKKDRIKESKLGDDREIKV